MMLYSCRLDECRAYSITLLIIGYFSKPFSADPIYTATGQKVTDLCDAVLSPGAHTFTWKPEHCATGLYLYLIRTGSDVKAGKMMLVR